jgi:hypothetical protein
MVVEVVAAGNAVVVGNADERVAGVPVHCEQVARPEVAV